MWCTPLPPLQAANTAYGEADASEYGYGYGEKSSDCVCAKTQKRDIYVKAKCADPKTVEAEKNFEVRPPPRDGSMT